MFNLLVEHHNYRPALAFHVDSCEGDLSLQIVSASARVHSYAALWNELGEVAESVEHGLFVEFIRGYVDYDWTVDLWKEFEIKL